MVITDLSSGADTARARALIEAQGLSFEPPFEDLVGVEKVGAVEQIETSVERCLVVRHRHSGLTPATNLLCQLLCQTIYVFP